MNFNDFFNYGINTRGEVRKNDIVNSRHNPFMVFANYLMDINEPGFHKERDVTIYDYWYDDNPSNSLTIEATHRNFDIEGEHLTMVERMLSGNGNEAKVIYDKTLQRTFVQTSSYLTNSDYVKVAALISKLMPWLFDDGYKPSDKYIEMIKLVSSENWDEVCKIIGSANELYKSRIAIESFYKNFHTNISGRVRTLREENQRLQEEINRLLRTISSHESHIQTNTFLILGLETEEREANDKEDVESYARAMDITFKETGDRSVVALTTYGFLDNYDEENARIFISKGKGALYSGTGTDKAWKRFFEKIFLTNEYKLALYSNHNIYIDRCEIHHGNIVRNVESHNGNAYLVSPHIMRFDCYGGNKLEILDAIKKYDSYSLFDNCKAANGNLNFADDTVVREFSRLIYDQYSTSNKILRSRNGEWKTVKEVYDECAAELGD